MRYKRKLEWVEAIKFDDPDQLRGFCPRAIVAMVNSRWHARIPTGTYSAAEAKEGDYVLKDRLGEFSVMSSRVFEAFYEPE